MLNWVYLRQSDNQSTHKVNWISPHFLLNSQSIVLGNASLTQTVGREVAEALSALSEHEPWILLLDHNLPASLQTLQWEALLHPPQTLAKDCLIVRYADIEQFLGLAQPIKQQVVLDFFPPQDWPAETRSKLDRLPSIKRGFAAKQQLLTGKPFQALQVIFAHGDQGLTPGLTNAQNQPIDLNNIEMLPNILWLFACGESTLYLQKWLAKHIQQKNIHWGIVAQDKINAQQSFELYHALSQTLHTAPENLYQHFFNLQQTLPETRALHLIGSPPQAQNSLIDNLQKSLVEYAIERNINPIRQQLEQIYPVESLFKQLLSLPKDLPKALKDTIVHPLCIYYAERIDQRKLSDLLNQPLLTSSLHQNTAVYTAKGLYRKGIFLKALVLLLNSDDTTPYYLITLNNLLSDLHLAELHAVLNQKITLLTTQGQVTQEEEAKWQGSHRVSQFKLGKLEKSLKVTERKWHLDASEKTYETPNLIYLYTLLSLTQTPKAQKIIQQARQTLLTTSWQTLKSKIVQKSDIVYLIRALALYVTFNEDDELKTHLNELFKKLHDHFFEYHKADIGPLAIGYGFSLFNTTDATEQWQKTQLRDELIVQHYHLEVGVIDYLHGVDTYDETWAIAIEIQNQALTFIKKSHHFLASHLSKAQRIEQKYKTLKPYIHKPLTEKLKYVVELGLFPY